MKIILNFLNTPIKEVINVILSLEKELNKEIDTILKKSDNEDDTTLNRLKYSNKLSSVQIVGTRMLLDSCNMYFTTIKSTLNICGDVIDVIKENVVSNYEVMLEYIKNTKGANSAELKYWRGNKELPYIAVDRKDMQMLTSVDQIACAYVGDGPMYGCIFINKEDVNEEANLVKFNFNAKNNKTITPDLVIKLFTKYVLDAYFKKGTYIKVTSSSKDEIVFNIIDDFGSVCNISIVLNKSKCYLELDGEIVSTKMLVGELADTFQQIPPMNIKASTQLYNTVLTSINNIMATLNNDSFNNELTTKKEVDFIYYHEYAHSVLYQAGVFDRYASVDSVELDRVGRHRIKYVNDELELQADAYAMLKTGMSVDELVNIRFNKLNNFTKAGNLSYLNNFNVNTYIKSIKKQLPIVKKLTNLSLLESITYIRNVF